uniref:Uncharacterized protein n=1 Tax=Cyprinus carpio TaxID=7962 RepID=A0A8C1XSM2_CYPCA
MAEVQEGRHGHKYDLQHPEAHMGDGERLVVAHVLAAGLQRVALERRLLVSPGGLHRCPQQQDPEDEEDGEPDFASCRGVRLDLFKKFPKCAPVTHDERCSGLDRR